MRLPYAALLAGSISLGLTIGMAHAEAVKVSPELTVFTQERAAPNDGGPTILRGSATRRGTVQHRGSQYSDLGPIQIGAGSTLWLADPLTGGIIACEPRRTSRVGSRYVHCFDDRRPY